MKDFSSLLLWFLICLTPFPLVRAQVNSYGEMLQLSNQASITAMGGKIVSSISDEAAFGAQNPAQFRSGESTRISLHQFFLPSQISMSSLGVGTSVGRNKLPLFVTLNYLNYGDFQVYNEFEELTGENVRAYDFHLRAGTSYQLYERMTIGASVGYLVSSYADLSSAAFTVDIGLGYQRDSSSWRWGLALQHAGGTLTKFGAREQRLPTNLVLGASKRLKHLPFTIHISYHNLHRWDLEFDNPYQEETSIFGAQSFQPVRSQGFLNMFMRHINIGGDLALGQQETVHLRFGFDYNKNQIIGLSNQRTLAGLSLGVGMRLKKLIYIDYAYTIDHYISNTHHIGISLDMNRSLGSGLLR